MGAFRYSFCVLLLIGAGPTAVAYTENPFLSVEEMKTGSPFDREVQGKTLHAVLYFKNQRPNAEVPAPEVVVSEDIENPALIAAVEAQGMPAWALKKGVNMYLMDLNVIVLGRRMKVHNLAHEYAHYVQMKYEKYTRDDASSDMLESDAVRVQNQFRED